MLFLWLDLIIGQTLYNRDNMANFTCGLSDKLRYEYHGKKNVETLKLKTNRWRTSSPELELCHRCLYSYSTYNYYYCYAIIVIIFCRSVKCRDHICLPICFNTPIFHFIILRSLMSAVNFSALYLSFSVQPHARWALMTTFHNVPSCLFYLLFFLTKTFV